LIRPRIRTCPCANPIPTTARSNFASVGKKPLLHPERAPASRPSSAVRRALKSWARRFSEEQALEGVLGHLELVLPSFPLKLLITDKHPNRTVIAGNPNVGKRLATIASVIVLMMILITGVIALRKPSAPTQKPPLHPSTISFRFVHRSLGS
jgi:hypothetical protein